MIARMTFKFLSDWKSAVDAEYLTMQGDGPGGEARPGMLGGWPVQPWPVANIITGLSPPALPCPLSTPAPPPAILHTLLIISPPTMERERYILGGLWI